VPAVRRVRPEWESGGDHRPASTHGGPAPRRPDRAGWGDHGARGDGGAGKRYVALALALAITSGAKLPAGLCAGIHGPVLCLDWESTEEEFAERALFLAQGLGCQVQDLHYKPMVAPLTAELGAVRAEVSRLRAVAVIVDSLAPASGSEPEGADAAVRTMTALRALAPASRVVVAHVSKAAAEGQGPARPFGSVFLQNLPRSVWEVRRSDADEGDDLLLALYHRKVNSGRKSAPMALRLTFTPGAVAITGADLTDQADLLGRVSIPQQCLRFLRAHGPQTGGALAEALDLAEASVLKALTRLSGSGQVVKGPTKPYVWAVPR
jgi:hypothetical protein